MKYLKGKIHKEFYLKKGGYKTLKSYNIPNYRNASLKVIKEYIPTNHITWLESRPFYFETTNFIFVHGGIKPGIPLKAQTIDDLLFGKEFWKSYEGYKTVIFGHVSTFYLQKSNSSFFRFNKSIGIDTGAASNNFLSFIEIDLHSQKNKFNQYKIKTFS